MINHNYDNYYGIKAKIDSLPHLRSGSWNILGVSLPELGATEKVSDLLGGSRDSSGGSNLIPDWYQNAVNSTVPGVNLGSSGSITSQAASTGPNTGLTGSDGQPVSTSDPGGGPTLNLGYTDPTAGGFGNSSNPDLSNQFKQDLYNQWLATQNQGDNGQSEADRAREQLRNDINSGWDNFLNKLGEVGSDFSTQKAAQESTAKRNYETNSQLIQNQKATSLRDIADTARNALQAGNNYLGVAGAGDSSANNMYQYAINRQVLKQSGALNEYVNTKALQLQTEYQNKVDDIRNWFAQQQAALKQAQANGELGRNQDLQTLSKGILENALQAVASAKAEASNRNNILMEWALNNSNTAGQIQNNIANIPQPIGGANLTSGDGRQLVMPGGLTRSNTDEYGNPING